MIKKTSFNNVPKSFLTTLRIFLWSNLLGMPWTVVKVLRPLRSGDTMLARCRVDCDKDFKGDTYAECVYGYTPGFAWFVRSRRRLRRRGLDIIKGVSRKLLAGRRVQKGLRLVGDMQVRDDPGSTSIGGSLQIDVTCSSLSMMRK